ncbi:hypothetical protein ACB092_11G013300 [Castanea dentata]
MSIIVWNCPGLGNLRTGKELEVMIRAKDPSVVEGRMWRFTGFYGEPVCHKRFESWNKLRQLQKKFNLPWLCARDFNEILGNSEKLGGSNRSQAQMQLFRDVVDECGFIDLGYSGHRFTWQKHFSTGHSIWERLNRALVTNDWLLRFVGTKCGKELTVWNGDHFGNVQTLLEQKRKELIQVEKEAMKVGQSWWLQELKKEIASLVDREQRMWLQRSKVLWASQGDRNSKFFHCRPLNKKGKTQSKDYGLQQDNGAQIMRKWQTYLWPNFKGCSLRQ